MPPPDWTRRAARRAAVQHGRLNRRQLLAFGASADAVRAGVAAGRLIPDPVFRGVYAYGHASDTRESRFIRTVLSCADDAVISHVSSAIHWGVLTDRPREPVHVSSQMGRAPSEVRIVHRLRGGPLHREDHLSRDGIPTTSLPRTILDVAECCADDDLEHVLNEAHFLYNIKLWLIERAAARAPGRHALKPVAALLAEYDDGTSWSRTRLERALKRIITATGLPKPQMNCPFGGYSIDAAWPELKLGVEVDGRSDALDAGEFRARSRQAERAGARRVAGPALHLEPGDEPPRPRGGRDRRGLRSAARAGRVRLAVPGASDPRR